MGHALDEIHRVLKPGGYVADIRPYYSAQEGNRRRARRQIVCLTDSGEINAGTLYRTLAMFRFTDRLMGKTLGRGHFIQTTRKTFHVHHYIETLSAFYAQLKSEWQEHSLPGVDRRSLEKIMREYPDATIRVDTPVQLNVLRKDT